MGEVEAGDPAQQARVKEMISGLLGVISHKPIDEARTALTIACLTLIVATSEDEAEMRAQVEGMGLAVLDQLARPEVVAWCRSSLFEHMQ